jgi:3-phosphoshikimate 1-carboxyvinyltransferase
MLIAPSLPVGLTIHLEGKTASRPYIEMTHSLLQQAGVTSVFKGNKIVIQHHEFQPQTIDLESDWSAASYFYGIAAMRRNSKIQLTNLNSDSFQGDSIIVKWFQEYFGVSSQFNQEGVQLNSTNDFKFPTELELDFTPYPDLAQTLVVLCACVGIRLKATGLESLLIKETNRLLALSTELEKIGVHSTITSNSIAIEGQIQLSDTPVGISTYQDHRMAMSFSLVSFVRPVEFDNEKVVSKSFPKFFDELEQLISS